VLRCGIAADIARPIDIDLGFSRQHVDIFAERDPRLFVGVGNVLGISGIERLVAGVGLVPRGAHEIGIKQLLLRLHFRERIGDFHECRRGRTHVVPGLGADLFLIGVEILEIAAEHAGQQRHDRQSLGNGEFPVPGHDPLPQPRARRRFVWRLRWPACVIRFHVNSPPSGRIIMMQSLLVIYFTARPALYCLSRV
jgi:hypothetical protein